MSNKVPSVGAVLVNYNGRRFLAGCVQSLTRTRYPRLRIVVVDNASTDCSVEALASEFPAVVILRQHMNLGVAAGNNLGIRHCLECGDDYVLLLNYDTIVNEDLVRELVRVADVRTLVTGKSYAWGRSGTINSHVGSFDWVRGRGRECFYGHSDGSATLRTQDVELADTSCLLVPDQTFADIGLMDEAFFLYYDDTDFIVRARRAGYRVVFHPDAVYWHYERGSTAPLDVSPITTYYANRNRLYFMRKHAPTRAHYVGFLGYFMATRLARLLFYIWQGQCRQIPWMFRGVWDAWHGKTGGFMRLHPPCAEAPVDRIASN